MTRKYKFIKAERKNHLKCKELENVMNEIFNPFKRKHSLVVDLKEGEMNRTDSEGNIYHQIILRFTKIPGGRGNNLRLYLYMDNNKVKNFKIRMRDTTPDYKKLLQESLNSKEINNIIGSIIEIEQ